MLIRPFQREMLSVQVARHLENELAQARAQACALVVLTGEGHRFDTPTGTTFSLLALSEDAEVDVTGASYPLEDTPLPYGVGLGVSNVTTGNATVGVRRGHMMGIRRDAGPDELGQRYRAAGLRVRERFENECPGTLAQRQSRAVRGERAA